MSDEMDLEGNGSNVEKRANRSHGGLRVSLLTLMFLILAAALAAATFAKLRYLIDPKSDEGIDLSAIFVIAIAVTGAALAGVRRYTGNQFLAHVSTAYAITTTAILFAELSDRLSRYWVQFIVAATIGIPFAIQGYLLRRRRWEKCEKRRLKHWVELIVVAHLTVGLAFVGLMLSIMASEWLNNAVKSARGRG